MLLLGLVIVDNVIKIDNNVAIEEESKYLVDKSVKYGWRNSEAKGHDKELV